jgi:hypothetical protein
MYTILELKSCIDSATKTIVEGKRLYTAKKAKMPTQRCKMVRTQLNWYCSYWLKTGKTCHCLVLPESKEQPFSISCNTNQPKNWNMYWNNKSFFRKAVETAQNIVYPWLIRARNLRRRYNKMIRCNKMPQEGNEAIV